MSSQTSESVIEFPIRVDMAMDDFLVEHDPEPSLTEEIQYHLGKQNTPIPVYASNSSAFDVKRALVNTVCCPVRYLSKAPPAVVTENYCFVIDGDVVKFSTIVADGSRWWKDTGTATRYYSTSSLKTFYQVTMMMSRGRPATAFRRRSNGGGMELVPLVKVFRVSRFFSYWRTCHNFHRIISLVNPVTVEGEVASGFKERIFIQYLWRCESKADKERVFNEHAAAAGVKVPVSQCFSMPARLPPQASSFLSAVEKFTQGLQKRDSLKRRYSNYSTSSEPQ